VKNTIPSLKKGDLIYITAPAKAIEKEYILFAKEFFEKQDFRVLVSEHCLGAFNYFSGTDAERLADLQFGIDNPEVKAIFCARGGYGCIRIVDQIQWASMLREPKWLVGYSDITIFHQRLQRFELPSIHGTMPFNFEKNSPEALETLLKALMGEKYTISCSADKFNKLGSVKGKLVGGNLSILYSLLGTDDQIDYSDTILFIEDLAEHLYHIDRMLFAFEKAGVFNKIKGLIVGGMTDLQDTDTPFGQTIEEIILRHFQYRKIPIGFNFPSGHIPDNRSLVLGKISELVINESETILNIN
jgi:muramoyltetrapeptide carboxypeptidase